MEIDTVKEENPAIQSDLTQPKYKVVDIGSVIDGKCSTGDSNIAINGVVAKVHVDRFNFDDFFADKTKYLQSDVNVRGKKRKLDETKQEELPSEEVNTSALENKVRKRGRPRKFIKVNPDEAETSDATDSENTQLKQVKKRGRPRKIDTPEKIEHSGGKSKLETQPKQLNKLPAEISRRFNGVSTSRVIKPNSRLQDFVVSSSVRYYARSPTVKPVKEIPTKAKEKPPRKINKVINEDPLNISNNADDDDYDDDDDRNKNTTDETSSTTTSNDDVVRSFLPIFAKSSHTEHNDKAGQSSKPNKQFKEKENQMNNLQFKFAKNNNSPKPKSFKIEEKDYSPPKLRARSDSKSGISTPKSQKSITKSSMGSAHHKQPTQNPAVNNNAVIEQGKQKLNDNENAIPLKQSPVAAKVASKAETKMNGSNNALKQHKTNVKYVLVDSDGARNKNKSPKVGDVDFNKLVRSLKLVKLPAANWKIRIVVSKQQTITEVTFTNKEVNERCIKFSRTIAGYVITFGKSIVKLLGAPSKISSFNDVSILLDIVHNISPNDPVLEYSTNSTV